jgi:DNA-binding GntR family transcriptional regulator
MPARGIDPDSATPVYRQVAGVLRDRITHGVWLPDRRLPSEPDLEAEFEISRDTVRRALDVLRDEGLIVTVRGRGSFVSPQK